jgi:carboxyl-terminal processing protease
MSQAEKIKSEQNFVNRQLIPVLTALSLFLGIFVGLTITKLYDAVTSDESEQTDGNTQQNQPTYELNFEEDDLYDRDYVNSVIDVFQERYLDDIDVESPEQTYGLLKGFVESLDDRYTSFLTPEETQAYLNQNKGDFEGIGVVLGYKENRTYIETVLKGNPAESAGLLPGDIILKVDEEEVQENLPSYVATKIRGEKGTKVKLTIFRIKDDNNTEELEFEIERNTIDIDNVSWESIDENTVKITINQFSDESALKFNETWDKVVNEIKSEKPNLENIVLDLRNNPGGYVYSVRYVMEEFFSKGEILMKERTKNKKETEYEDERNGEFEDVDLAVLVNEGSASASEILAAAVQENERGEVVGKKTVGKGVEQELINLPDGSMIIMVFQEWLTPNGRRINEDSPITPDHEVDYSIEDFKAGQDKQLDKALELIK